ncbi:heme-binding protein [Novosphingobium sp. 9]|uniref:heme-binding protein n=1 Tax=Novosphingobium sp. 9 TaxID=2025349 RepID=UPI0021B6152D|nr:heme-binding protein [Novosphingobium sp. 9]
MLSSSPLRLALIAAAGGLVALGCGAAQAVDGPDPLAAALPVPAYVPSLAQRIAAMPKNLPRAEAPPLDAAIAAARAAVSACAAKGAPVSVLVADVNAQPVVLLSGDGAGVRSMLIAQTKANIVAKYGKPSLDVANLAETNHDTAVSAVVDPDIGVLRGGGFPLMHGKHMFGIVAASGGSLGGDKTLDEQCAQVAVAMLEGRKG